MIIITLWLWRTIMFHYIYSFMNICDIIDYMTWVTYSTFRKILCVASSNKAMIGFIMSFNFPSVGQMVIKEGEGEGGKSRWAF